METVWPPMVKLPLRFCELELAVTDHGAVFPETETDAQLTPELAAAAGQSLGLGVMPILPLDPPAPTFTLLVLNEYEHAEPACDTATFLPPIVKLLLRPWELGFPLTLHPALVPLTKTEAQVTLELAVAAGQSLGLGAIAMLPVAPPGPALTLDGFTA